jgi:hypothetical protein
MSKGDQEMKNSNRRPGRQQQVMWAVSLLVLGYLFGQPTSAVALTNWPAGILNDAAEAIAARSRVSDSQTGNHSQNSANSQVTIQSMTAGKIVKFQNGAGAVEDSVITELTGLIGIGTSSPTAQFSVAATSTNSPIVIKPSTSSVVFGGHNLLEVQTVGGAVLGKIKVYRFGPGQGDFDVSHWYADGFTAVPSTTHAPGIQVWKDINASRALAISLGVPGQAVGDDAVFSTYTGTAWVQRMTLLNSNGNFGIGTAAPLAKLHVAGDALIDGNIAAKYQDIAEWVPASHAISAGTVVVLDGERSNHVLPSAHAYDTRVAGVISAKPGLLLGDRGESKVMVATTGRVRVKVDATSAPIRVGDLLVTSDKEGIAMRSQPLDLGGTPIHRPGTLIGKALEPLDKGTGEILVLLSLQ